jgi:hypothetical protein
MPDRLSIANAALAEISAAPIQSFDEVSLEARECTRAYDACLAELMEAHDWSFASRRVALAELANDRPAEWGHAYAVPADLARALRVLPSRATHLPADGTAPFEIAAGRLYCGLADALLDYAVERIGEDRMTAGFARALASLLAVRISAPIRKDRTMKGDLIKQAELDRQRAIADDLNRQPRTDPPYLPEGIAARSAGGRLLGTLSIRAGAGR